MEWLLIACCGVVALVFIWAMARDRNRRIADVARIEAELKMKLVERLGDASLVREVLEAHMAGVTGGPVAALPRPRGTPPEWLTTTCLLLGLVGFLVGITLTILGFSEGFYQTERVVGLLTGAAGLALLTFATSQKQIRRHVSVDDVAGRSRSLEPQSPAP